MSYSDSQREISDLKDKIKVLEARLENNYNVLVEVNGENADNLSWAKSLQKEKEKLAEERDLLNTQVSELSKRLKEADVKESDHTSAEAAKIRSALERKIADLEARLQNNQKCLEELLLEKAYLQSDLDNLRTESIAYKEICHLTKSNDWLRDRNSALEKAIRNSSFSYLYTEEKKKVEELETKVADLEAREEKLTALEEIVQSLESENRDLKKQISVFEKEKSGFSNEIKNFERKILDLSKTLFDERKAFKFQNAKLSQQISDFEQVLVLERESFENQRKSFSEKNVELSMKISDLETELDIGRKESEKRKVEGFQEKCLKDDFAREKKIFQTEIRKLSRKLSELATEIMKEQKVKSDFQKRFDLMLEERNILSAKVKQLEESKFKSSSASSSLFTSSSSRKSNALSKDRIRPSNLFYNSRVDNTDNLIFRKVKMVWRKKSTTEDSDGNTSYKSPVVDSKSFISKTDSPTYVYSTAKLISLSRAKIHCTHHGNNDFDHSRYDNRWYGTYSIPGPHFTVKAPNHQGSIKAWIPKSF